MAGPQQILPPPGGGCGLQFCAGQGGRCCAGRPTYLCGLRVRRMCMCTTSIWVPCARVRVHAHAHVMEHVFIRCRLMRRWRRAVQRVVGRRGGRGRRCGEAIQTSGCSRRGSRCSPRGSRTGEGRGGGAQSNVSPRVNVCALCMCMHVSCAGAWPDPCVHACAFARKCRNPYSVQ